MGFSLVDETMEEMDSTKLQLVLNFGRRKKRYLIKRFNVKKRIAKRLKFQDTNFELERLSYQAKGWEKVEENELKDKDEIRVKDHSMSDAGYDSDAEAFSDAETCVNIRKKLKKNERLEAEERTLLYQILWLIEPKVMNGVHKKDKLAIVEVSDKKTQTCGDQQILENNVVEIAEDEINEASNGIGSIRKTSDLNSSLDFASSKSNETGNVEEEKDVHDNDSKSDEESGTEKRKKESKSSNRKNSNRQKYGDNDSDDEWGTKKKKASRASNRRSSKSASKKKYSEDKDDESDTESKRASRASSSRSSNSLSKTKYRKNNSDDESDTENKRTSRASSSRSSNSLSKAKYREDESDTENERASIPSNHGSSNKNKEEKDLQDNDSKSENELIIDMKNNTKKRKSKISNPRSPKKSRKSDVTDFSNLAHSTIMKKLKSELNKDVPDPDILCKLMDASFPTRQNQIINQNPSVKEILKTYPVLHLPEQVMGEYSRIKNDVDFKLFMKNLRKFSDAIIKNLPSSSLCTSTTHEGQFVNMALLTGNTPEMKSALAILLLPTYFSEDATNFISFGPEKKNVYPMLICNKKVGDVFKDDCEFKVQVENSKLCVVKKIEEAFYLYMASFYIFSIEFPESLMHTISLVESLLLGGEPESVIEKVEDVKNKLISNV